MVTAREPAITYWMPDTTVRTTAIANLLLWTAVVLTVVTGLQYLLDGRSPAPKDPAAA